MPSLTASEERPSGHDASGIGALQIVEYGIEKPSNKREAKG
jgi:hypothetical protein